MLIEAVKRALKNAVIEKNLSEVMDYAVFPAGKLFRPRLIEALAQDLGEIVSQDYLHLASAIELHHAYTLVHDDLPAMDNDLIRRGRPSTHAQYGEWKAILAGDALLVASFQELAQITHKNFLKIHRLMTWATGAKGLIAGQFLDLTANGKLSVDEVVRIHELKTGRLIQLATLGSYLLSESGDFRKKIDFLRLGREIGVSFQLLDDLSELTENNVSIHEKNINPFVSSLTPSLNELRTTVRRLMNLLEKYQLVKTENMLNEYFRKNQKNLLANFSKLEKNIGKDMDELKSWLTSFV